MDTKLEIKDKQAKVDFEIADIFKKRWSPRSFSPEIPSEESLMKLFEAARWAASSYNEQPWRFIIGIKDKGDSYKKVYDCLNEFNQEWAKNAPVLMIICGKENFSHNDKPNSHFIYDLGASMANFSNQAVEEDLLVHQMAGFSPDKAKEIFNIPDGYRAVTAAAIGYKGDPENLDEKFQKGELAERSRKPLEELIFIDEWEESFNG